MSERDATTVAAALKIIELLIDRLLQDGAISAESAAFIRENIAKLR